MVDPVRASDDKIYDREAIEQWFTKSSKSPLTNLPLMNLDLEPLPKLKTEIHTFKKNNHVDFRKGGHFRNLIE